MTFFHFTSAEIFNAMQEGRRGIQQPLVPQSVMISEADCRQLHLPLSEPVIFGFMSKFDPPWYTKKYDHDVPYLQKVLSDISTNETYGICLLEINLSKINQEPYVIDRIAGIRVDNVDLATSTLKVRDEAIRSFWNSHVSLAEYRQRKARYMMPELILYKPVAFEHLRLVDVYKKHDVINEVRFLAGCKPYPSETRPQDETHAATACPAEPLQPSPKHSHSHLRLVHE